MSGDAPKSFGDLLRMHRIQWSKRAPKSEQEPKRRKLTQEGLSEKVGVSADYISQLENGKKSPGVDLVSFLVADLELTEAEQEEFESAAERVSRQLSRKTEKSIARGLEADRHSDGLGSATPGVRFVNPPPFLAPDYFQDRLVETGLVARFIRDDAIRMVTVVGRSGVGKTALVCRLLRALESGSLPDDGEPLDVDGIVYLSNAGRHQLTFANLYADLGKLLPQHLADRLASVYRDPEASTRFKMRELLAEFRDGRFVVLLDNFEDLMDDQTREVRDAEMDEALRAVLELPHHAVTVVLTTRIAPRALGMVQLGRQRSLALDEGLPSPFAEELLREMDPTGALGLKTAPDELLREARMRTNGYPRALEALFAILSTDRDASLRDILDDTRSVLPEDVMRVLVGEAFDRLDPDARLVMQALAIYHRPVTPTAVDYLLQPWLPTVDAAPVLNRLVNLRLVRKEAGRYYLHTTDRAYALSQIPIGDEGDRASWQDPARVGPPPFVQYALRDRGASYFAAVRKPRDEWRSIDDLEPQLAEIDLRCDAGDHDAAARVLQEIDRDPLFIWGHHERVAGMFERLRGNLTDLDLEQHCTGYLGRCHANQGRHRTAIDLTEQALAIARAMGDRRGQGIWLNNLSIYYGRLGQIQKAIDYIEGKNEDVGALQMAREAGNARALGARLHNLSLYYRRLGDVQKAKNLIEGPGGALQIAVDAGDQRGQGLHLWTLALVAIDEGNFDQAIRYCRDAIVNADVMGRPQSLCYRYTDLACAMLFAGELDDARVAATCACGYDVPLQNHRAQAVLGMIAARQGDQTAAQDAFEAAVANADVMLARNAGAYGVLDAKAFALCGLALIGDTARLAEAVACYRAARAITCEAGVVRDALRLLDALTDVDPNGLLAAVRPIAGGEAS